MKYAIFVQYEGGRHRAFTNFADEADGFARFVHKAATVPVLVYDNRRERVRLNLGGFDESKV